MTLQMLECARKLVQTLAEITNDKVGSPALHRFRFLLDSRHCRLPQVYDLPRSIRDHDLHRRRKLRAQILVDLIREFLEVVRKRSSSLLPGASARCIHEGDGNLILFARRGAGQSLPTTIS